MSFAKVSPGNNPPNDINVVIEIPMGMGQIKYEVDKDTGLITADRFMKTCMHYPANYGYIPNTLADDDDPVDVLVLTPFPLVVGSVINARVIGMLNMHDESGHDVKVIAVPSDKITKIYSHINNYKDLDPTLLQSIEHFFKHYKDLDEGKWVKIESWEDKDLASSLIEKSIK